MRLKQFSKRTISIFLSVLMILSTLMVGTISTANAADTSANTSSAEISANTSGATFDGGSTLYLKPSENWKSASARFAAYFMKSDKSPSTSIWVSMGEEETGTYCVDIPSGSWSYVIFCRMNGGTTENNWPNVWNQTFDVTPPNSNQNLFVINDNDNDWYVDDNDYYWDYHYQSMNFSGGYIYFDNTNSAWTDSHIMLLIGNDGHTKVQEMNKITGTNLYYCNIAGYDNAKYFAVVGDSSVWNDATSGFDTRKGSSTNHYTYVCTNYCFNSGSTYLLTPNDGTTDTGLTPSNLSSYDAFNSTQTAKAQLSTDGSSYSDSTTAGTIQISSHKISNNGTSTAVSQQSSAVSVNAAKTATVTLTATASNGCEFMGWYDANGVQKSTSTTFTYTANGAATYYARFTGDPTPIDPDAVYTITTGEATNGSYSADKTEAKAGTTVTINTVPNQGYIVGTVTVTAANGTSVEVTGTGNTRTFVMPTSNVTVNVTFTGNTSTWKYYGYDTGGNARAGLNPKSMQKGYMNGHEFSYVEINTYLSSDSLFYVYNGTTKYDYSGDIYKKSGYGSDVQIGDYWASSKQYAKVNSGNTYYIVVYYPNTNYETWNNITVNNSTNSNPLVVAYSFLPGDAYVDTFTVSIDQGVKDFYFNSDRGSSKLHTGDTSHNFNINDNTVTFTTETYKKTGSELGIPDDGMFIYKVYGYSILINYKDGSTKVVSIDEHAISTPVKGTYTASYTFEPNEKGSNVKSAVVTPVFTSSDEYAELKGINYTTVYLKATPGDNLLQNSYEPRYYTWRVVERKVGDSTVTDPYITLDDNTRLQSLPEGTYNGQKMLYIGNNRYKAIVEDKILGILFVEEKNYDGCTQTFDYSEFIKLQKLGYDEITYEPKAGISGGVAANLHNGKNGNDGFSGNGNYVYNPDTTDCSFAISSEDNQSNFELDVNIEGYYVDVFGNKLLDADGKPIKQTDLRNEMTGEVNTSTESTALLEKMGILNDPSKEQALFGARYGVVTEDKYYGMTYAIRVYYFEATGNKTYMVSQQVSGYGTIEGANSPIQSGVTNAQAHYNKYGTYMQYALGPSPTNTAAQNFDGTVVDGQTIDVGYDLIPRKFVNVPFFVSYQTKVNPRIDGKWYYQETIPLLDYEIKPGLMDSDDNLQVDSTTKEIIEDATGGTGIFSESGDTKVQVLSGNKATLVATTNPGYKFVGFFEPNGTRISSSNYYQMTIAGPGTVFAVFQPIENNSVVVTNNVYRGSNPQDGGGNGDVTVTLNVYSDEAGTTLLRSITGKNIAQLEIADEEYFQWVITGVPSGVDTFVGFRTPDPETGYYGILDVQFDEYDYGYQYVDGVHSYTSAMMLMDWSNYEGTTLTIENATDFNKTSYLVDLHYTYKDRYEQQKTYIVTGIELSVDEMQNNNYRPYDETIEKYAPYIDEVFKDCTWNVNEDRSNVTQTGAVYTLEAKQEYKNFITYIGIGVSEDLQKEVSPFNSTVYLEAPQSRVVKDKDGNDKIENFLYWKQYRTDADGKILGDESEVNILSYYPRARVRVTFDSIIYAVYGDNKAPDFATSVKDPVYTREQYTENGVNFDYVYADLLLQYDISKTFSNGATFKEFFNDNIKFGIVLENEYGNIYSGGDLTGPSASNSTYVGQRNDLIKDLASGLTSGGRTSSWSTSQDENDGDYNFYYNVYDLTNNVNNLTDLGRLDYIIRFANTEKNQGIVYNVYSYILYTNPETNETTLYLSSPKVMNIYEIGNKTVDSNVTT